MSASHKFYKKRRKYYPTISRFRVSSFSLFDLHKAKTLNRFILLFFVFAFMFPPLFFVFFPQSLSRHLPDLTVYMSNKGNCLPFASTWVYPRFFFYGVQVAHLFRFFMLSHCVSLRSEFRVVMSVAISTWKWCSVHLCLQLYVGGWISYLRFLCFLADRGILHILCCGFFLFVFHRFVYPMLSVSLNCSFLIAPSVFSNVY